MKKLMSMLLCVAAMTFAACDREQNNFKPDDNPDHDPFVIVEGRFAVGDGKYVRFSKGNLQYQPSTKK